MYCVNAQRCRTNTLCQRINTPTCRQPGEVCGDSGPHTTVFLLSQDAWLCAHEIPWRVRDECFYKLAAERTGGGVWTASGANTVDAREVFRHGAAKHRDFDTAGSLKRRWMELLAERTRVRQCVRRCRIER